MTLRRKTNTALAGRGTGDARPSVTPGHWREPAVREARQYAENTTWTGNHRARKLGQGNFGIVFDVEDRTRTHHRAVKLATSTDIHGQAWTWEAQERNILHEAGVANELAALGFTIVPRGVYTTFGRGTPAFVRELGTPAQGITGPEYADIERQLVSIEVDHRWRVADDDPALYRRADGTLFFADVGFWRAPRPGVSRAWSAMDSNLGMMLGQVQHTYLVGLGDKKTGAPIAPPRDRPYDVRGVPTTVNLMADVKGLASGLEFLREEGKPLRSDKLTVHMAEHLVEGVAARAALGVPTPSFALDAAREAQALLDTIAREKTAKENRFRLRR